MKLDCQQVLTQFASFSVEELSDSEAASLLQHVEECEPCKGQWLLFEKSLTVFTQSGPRDEDVEQVRSQQMWLVCMEHARQNVEKHSLADAHAHKSVAEKSGVHVGEDSQNNSVISNPRAGMTIVVGALFILASSCWLTPRSAVAHDVVKPAKTEAVVVTPLMDYGAMLNFKSLSATAPKAAKTKSANSIAKFRFR